MARSTQAQAAAIIRKEIKAHGIKARVTSDGYAGGNSVNVYVKDLEPWVRKELESFVNQFQYGHFDGMQDLYEYSNSRDDIPQVKYAFVECTYSDELKQKAYDYLRANWGGYEDHPENYADAADMQGSGDWVSTEVFQVLNGSWDDRCSSGCTKFWNKPRVRSAA